jgi:hypothetical protein
MNALKLLAIALIVAGGLGLAYGSFSFTTATQEAKVGPLTLSIEEKKTVNIPLWLGIGAMALGGLLLVFGDKRR